MKEQILEILKKENLTYSQFADKIGVQRSSVSHVISGRNKPGFEFIRKVLEAFPGINADWLIQHKGEMYSQIKPSEALFDVEAGPVLEKGFSGTKTNKIGVTGPANVKDTAPGTKDTPEIERIIVFYNDKTFREYLKES